MIVKEALCCPSMTVDVQLWSPYDSNQEVCSSSFLSDSPDGTCSEDSYNDGDDDVSSLCNWFQVSLIFLNQVFHYIPYMRVLLCCLFFTF
jgi:hypothetical protein